MSEANNTSLRVNGGPVSKRTLMKYSWRVYSVLLLMLLDASAWAQTDTLVDERDGNRYATIVIGNKTWMREHLRYAAPGSFFFTPNSRNGKEFKGNYYGNAGLEKVCPGGWRVATLQDWQAYMEHVVALKKLPADSIRKKPYAQKDQSIVALRGLDLLRDTVLQLAPIGWVEGNSIANDSTLTIWISDPHSNDNRFHVHIAPQGYEVHAHKHHIVDNPGKVRRFAVRCVSGVTSDK